MRHAQRPIGRAVFGAAVLAALGFGTAQAFAAPGIPARNDCSTYPVNCNDLCQGYGYLGGSCVNGAYGPKCLCY